MTASWCRCRSTVDHLEAFLTADTAVKNLDGIIVTVPHKFACYAFCSSATERSRLLGSVNIMRRRAEGGWHGDIVDGVGFVGAVRANGGDPTGKRALQIGAGGAGSAIALALVEAGVRSLAIHDDRRGPPGPTDRQAEDRRPRRRSMPAPRIRPASIWSRMRRRSA